VSVIVCVPTTPDVAVTAVFDVAIRLLTVNVPVGAIICAGAVFPTWFIHPMICPLPTADCPEPVTDPRFPALA